MYRITEVSELGQPCAPKKIKDKFVSQCVAIVRDNMPIKYREWKGKPSNPEDQERPGGRWMTAPQ
jgi:hypothetical protein